MPVLPLSKKTHIVLLISFHFITLYISMDHREIEGEVSHWISEVGNVEYADRKCDTYSGGNKRKLNMAQALVVDPISHLH